jgi:RNA polymerase sigma factor (sigma-70 family)
LTSFFGGRRLNSLVLPAEIDPLLEPLLAAHDDQAESSLSELITTHLQPVIQIVIRYKLHFNIHRALDRAEFEDIGQDVLVQVLAEVRKFRQQPEAHPISDVRGLAAVIAHRACARWMRRHFPARHAFKNRLHYLLTKHTDFAVWPNEKRHLMAGFAAWKGRKRAAAPERLTSLSADEPLRARIGLLATSGKHVDAGAILAAVFDRLGGPVEFDELVRALAELVNLPDEPAELTDQFENTDTLTRAAGETDLAWQVEKRIFLQRLWEEIRELPRNQRAALLLNLRDAGGRGCIALFPAAGIATVRHLAAALEICAEDFAALWNDLPLDDARIAELLNVKRQQVINLRKSARERLTRRLRGFL